MKKTLFFIAIALLLGACTKIESDRTEPAPGDSFIFTATAEIPTKTALDGSYNILWSASDKIHIQPTVLAGAMSGAEFVLSEGEGTTEATFEPVTASDVEDWHWGDISSIEAKYAYTDQWPSAQTYVEGAISNVPMRAISSSSSLAFKNIGGLLRLTVKGENPISKIEITAAQKISGAISGYASSSATASALVDQVSGSNKITLTVPDVYPGTEGKAFYIAMPTSVKAIKEASGGEGYSGVSISVTDVFGNVVTKTLKDGNFLNIERSKITDATISVCPALTSESPEGTVGVVEGRKGIVVNLDCGKTAIAMENLCYYGTDNDAEGHRIFNGIEYYWIYPDLGGTGWHIPSNTEFSYLLDVSTGHKVDGTVNDWEWTFAGTESTLYFPYAPRVFVTYNQDTSAYTYIGYYYQYESGSAYTSDKLNSYYWVSGDGSALKLEPDKTVFHIGLAGDMRTWAPTRWGSYGCPIRLVYTL